MTSAWAVAPRPSRRPALTAVIVSGDDAPATADRLNGLTTGIGDRDDVEIVLMLTGPVDEAALAQHRAAVMASTPGSYQVVHAPGADLATVVSRGVGAARGQHVTFLGIGDEVSRGYLSAVVRTLAPDTIGVAAEPGWTPAWIGAHPIAQGVTETSRITGKVFPVDVLRDVPVPTDVAPGACGALLLARIAGSYRHQHVAMSAAPARAGAVHRGRGLEDDDAHQRAMSGLADLAQHDDRVDPRSAEALSRIWMDRLRREISTGRRDLTHVHEALRADGVDVQLGDLVGPAPSRALVSFFTEQEPKERHLVVVLDDVERATGFSSALRGLARCGDSLVVVHADGEPSSKLVKYALTIDVREDEAAARSALSDADQVVTVGRGAKALLHRLAPECDHEHGVDHVLAAYLDKAARSSKGSAMPEALNRAAKRLSTSGEHLGQVDPWTWPVLTFAVVRLRAGAHIDDLVTAGEQALHPDSPARTALDAVRALDGAESLGARGLQLVADRVLATADETDPAEERIARFLHYLAMCLLFEPTQHTSVPSTPLVEAPERHLGALRSSRRHRRVIDVTRPVVTPRTPRRPGHAVLFAGAFPKFHGVLHEALSVDHTVERVDLSGIEPRFRNVIMDPVTFVQLLDTAEGRRSRLLDRSVTHQVGSAEIVVVDWADKGLALASRVVGDHTRLFVRVHGVDTLSPWAHLTRWDRVDGIIAPSEHLARALVAAVGPALDGVPVHVVPNPVDAFRFTLDSSPAARHTLGLVGWAQRVKDPHFALDTLGLLRAEDPRWRLRLVGNDFPDPARPVEQAAADAFRRRSTRKDVAGGIDFVPFTSDVGSVMSDIGWALSTSLRESFHLGLFEMAASGAVPVVRDWPVYAGTGGVATLVPEEWVIASPEAAAERILRTESDWEEQRHLARQYVVDHFDHGRVVERLRDIFAAPVPTEPPDLNAPHGSTH